LIPLHDLERPRRPPVVTRLLLALNVAVWLYVLTLLGNEAALRAFYERWSFDLAREVAALHEGPGIAALAPLVTHQFVHAGWPHLLGNLLYLWIFGDNVEDRLGHARFLGVYIVCGTAAALGQGLAGPGPLVGASGAIAGVLGGYLVLSPGARVRTLLFLGVFITVVTLPAIVVIGEWIVIQVISGLEMMRIPAGGASGGIAYVAHVVGFASGALLVPLLRGRRR